LAKLAKHARRKESFGQKCYRVHFGFRYSLIFQHPEPLNHFLVALVVAHVDATVKAAAKISWS
jgi:hypothetical protein